MPLHIVNLQAENYKRLTAVNITPDTNIVTLSGRNAQGKSSVLDAIFAALAGGDASRVTKQPIRDGEKTATVRLDLGDYIVTRKWTSDDAGTVTVESPPTADGRRQKYSSPQKLLDDLVGQRAFDPLAFTRMTATEQVATLVGTVTLPFDPVELDRERATVFDERTQVNRDVKTTEGHLAGLTTPDADTPTVMTSSADVLAEFEQARRHNETGELLERQVLQAHQSRDSAADEVTRLREALDRATLDAANKSHTYDEAVAAAALFDPINTDAITARLSTIEATNAAIHAAQEHRRVAATLTAKRDLAAELTANLQAIDKRKADALAAAEFPVTGLSFDDTGVTYQGIPFAQASAAEQLRVSAALAMAANPELRILQVRDGSLLDTESMQTLTDLATAHDYQVWVEVVDDTGTVGIVIENGTNTP